MENIVNFELEESQHIDLEDYSDKEYCVAKLKFISNRPNSHKLEISEEVLRECAGTAKGKWLVGKLNITKDDLQGHEPDEQIIGLIPKEQEVEFVEADDGYIEAVVDAVISKIYAKDFCDVLVKDGKHSVSVEMVVDSAENRGVNDTVNAFNILSVALLGRTIRPSVPGADIELVRFAENAETYFDNLTTERKKENMQELEQVRKEGENAMNEIEFSAVDIGDLWTSLYNALRHKYEGYDYCIQDIYEKDGQKFALIKKYGEDVLYRLDFTLTADGLTLADEMTKVEIEVVETDEIRKFAEPENVEQYRTFAESEKDKEKEDKGESDKSDEGEKNEKPDEDEKDEKDEKAKMSERIAELEAELTEKNNAIAESEVKLSAMDTELTELREFKRTAMEAEKMSKIEVVMSKYSGFMTEDEAKSYKAEGVKCDFAELDAWSNKVAASVADNVIAQKQSKKPDEEITRMSGIKEFKRETESGSPLDRLKNKYLN